MSEQEATIWKFPIKYGGVQSVMMPEGARVLTAAYQDDVLCLWAIVDPEGEMAPRSVSVYGTGWQLPKEPGTYIATVQRDGFVWHVFEGGV